ncbi:hypothetical protein LCM10_01820 [Rossellomorea aquimaris]|uniref:hypothetical protein n=1 Tax=Rossellomorea aquimaris TaxID=189382 RepID=UPI001CD2EDFE|nr:hypothetical protein [Rossellomorea aquimaris]MCA1053708.1 hypothetical protein [Rossellomorea aquimaris]
MKQIKLTVIILVICTLFLMAGYVLDSNDKVRFYDTVGTTDLSEETVNGMSHGSTEDMVLRVLKDPHEVTEIQSPQTTYLSYDNIEFGMEEHPSESVLLHQSLPNVQRGISRRSR